jgi:hypothetical protein
VEHACPEVAQTGGGGGGGGGAPHKPSAAPAAT